MCALTIQRKLITQFVSVKAEIGWNKNNKNYRFSKDGARMQTHDWTPVFGRLIIIALVRASHAPQNGFLILKRLCAALGWQQYKKSCQGRRLLLSSCGDGALKHIWKYLLNRLLSRVQVNYEHLQKFQTFLPKQRRRPCMKGEEWIKIHFIVSLSRTPASVSTSSYRGRRTQVGSRKSIVIF